MFSFSERDHTDAVNISPKVKPETILERSQILQGLSSEKKNKFYKQNIGSKREVLIESCENELLSGLTENYIRIHTVGKPEEVNTIIPLQMKYMQGEVMWGMRVS